MQIILPTYFRAGCHREGLQIPMSSRGLEPQAFIAGLKEMFRARQSVRSGAAPFHFVLRQRLDVVDVSLTVGRADGRRSRQRQTRGEEKHRERTQRWRKRFHAETIL